MFPAIHPAADRLVVANPCRFAGADSCVSLTEAEAALWPVVVSALLSDDTGAKASMKHPSLTQSLGQPGIAAALASPSIDRGGSLA